ncbi:MAG TPA: 5-methyltetrahydropteroyltriglutamate--homocysteine S-methyltransferase [Gemmatimonadaceae bacterium]|nr:5-methyltetrahydropteroyltriglutamate--homocysteine S-methyltransferase [Gemmatimonadaceae bacterium]
MTIAANLGFPRIGSNRELKRALEDHWAGRTSRSELASAARSIRRANWEMQARAGIDHVPSGDFSLYDHVLDTAVMLGAVPERFGRLGGVDELDRYFAMARGTEAAGESIAAMEMTKWFDTNYHYIVPELEDGMELHLASSRVVDEFLEAKELGILTRPVILGPISFLMLAKSRGGTRAPLAWLDRVLPVYEQLLAQLHEAGADWVQIDEPCLVLDLDEDERSAYGEAYQRLGNSGVRICLATYFGGLGENLSTALALPVAALHLDLVRAPEQLEAALEAVPERLVLSLGVLDGRNVWRTDLDAALDKLSLAASRIGPDRLMVAPSCSLVHVPVDLEGEEELDDELRGWLAFGKQKLHELSLLVRALREGTGAVESELAESRRRVEERRASPRIHVPAVAAREQAVRAEMLERAPFADRSVKQADALALPPLPTTTIGSFPQTRELRRVRAAFRSGSLSRPQYDATIRGLIQDAIHFQEDAGLDVLVHGEFERNDMVEFFGERLSGFVFTRNGWVQSYGSRCVKPPIIYGDVARPRPMTVAWTVYAQSLTHRPVKGMLTGPVTMLQWSFVRDDQPRERTCRQLALAIRDETLDLEAAGIQVIQIDEPAIREGLPLRSAERDEYLRWAVEAFRLASSGVREETQIHTHMCYSEFDDIIDAVARMDADVLSIETSRSDMELLDTFGRTGYPNAVGPGVYDVHSPVVPETDAIEALLLKALAVLAPQQLWVNPDCGLKTRRWEEVRPAMVAMVGAARRLRERVGVEQPATRGGHSTTRTV